MSQTTVDGFWITDTTGNFLDVNDVYCEMSGYSREELMSMNVSDVETIENSRELSKHLHMGIEEGFGRFETVHRRKDNSTFDVEVSFRYLPLDGGSFVVFLRDITDRKQAESKLRESEALFRIIYERITVGVVRVSLDFHIEAANDAFCKMLGYREDELVGKSVAEVTLPEDVEENRSLHLKMASGEIEHFRLEKTYIHKDGRLIHCLIDPCLVRDDEGKPKYALGSVLDICDRKTGREKTDRDSKANPGHLQCHQRRRVSPSHARSGFCQFHRCKRYRLPKIWIYP